MIVRLAWPDTWRTDNGRPSRSMVKVCGKPSGFNALKYQIRNMLKHGEHKWGNTVAGGELMS